MPTVKTISKIAKFKPPKRALKESSFCSAVIAAAGSSQRCGGENKLLHEIDGKPILVHTIEAFQRCALVLEIVVVVKAEQLESIASMCREYKLGKVSKVIAGGETRAQSVYNGIFSVSDKAKLIAIHDGARPCIDTALIKKTIKTAAKYHAAAPGIPVISTIKRASDEAPQGYGRTITETLDRVNLYEIQTPQVFRAEVIKAAHTYAAQSSMTLTDDCMAVELLGMPVHIVEGSRRNIKITEPDDLIVAEKFLTS